VTSDGKVHAPFSADQIESLNAYQESEYTHPYTCGSPACPAASWAGDDDWLPMAADADGLHCIDGCRRVQTWAHAWTADWSWREVENAERQRREREAAGSYRQIRRHMRILASSRGRRTALWLSYAGAASWLAAAFTVPYSWQAALILGTVGAFLAVPHSALRFRAARERRAMRRQWARERERYLAWQQTWRGVPRILRPEGMVVHHIDVEPRNNDPANLTVMRPEENAGGEQ